MLLFLIAIVAATARRQVIVGDFVETKADDPSDASGARIDLADILRGEIARLADLLHVVATAAP